MMENLSKGNIVENCEVSYFVNINEATSILHSTSRVDFKYTKESVKPFVDLNNSNVF